MTMVSCLEFQHGPLTLFIKMDIIIIFHAVLSVGYNPDSYSFGESSGSGQILAALSGDPGVFTVFASYQTNDGSAIG